MHPKQEPVPQRLTFALIPEWNDQTAVYAPQELHGHRMASPPSVSSLADPPPLQSFHAAALLASHAAISPSDPRFGRYRTVNLRRTRTFLDHHQVSTAVDALLARAAVARLKGPERLAFAAQLFSDFLSIHPFINANRRMAMRLVSDWLALQGTLNHSWSEVSRGQIYHAVRCGIRGHHGPLIKLIERTGARTVA